MRIMTNNFLAQSALTLSAAALCGIAAFPDHGVAQTRVGAVLSADGGYSTSPFGSGGNTSGAATGTVRVAPVVSITRETSTLSLGGNVTHTEYSRQYDSTTNFGANLVYRLRADPRTNINASANFDSSILSGNQAIVNPVVDPNNPNLPPVLDPSATGRRERRSDYRAALGLQHQFSSTDSVHIDGSATAVRASAATTLQREYNYGAVTAGYDKTINDRLTVGGVVSLSRSNYLRTRLSDTTTIAPMLSVRLRLSSYWTISARGGVNFISSQELAGKRKSTSASGSLSACNTDERWNTCLTASRSVLPSSFNGTGNQTSLGLTTSYSLDEYSRISGTVSYARSKRLDAISRTTDDYLSTSASYSRRLNERLSARVSAGYSDSFKSTVARKANVSGSIGVSYNLGNI